MHAVESCLGGKKRLVVAMVALGIVAGAGTEGSAATYYVNNQVSHASDSNSGSTDRPWRTLAKASRTVRPGDTVIVRPGQYHERVNFYDRNLSNATVTTTFKSDPPGAFCRGFDTLYAPYLKIEGFLVSPPSSTISTDWTAKYGIFVRSNKVQILGNYIYNVAGVGIQAYWTHPWPDGVVVKNNLIRRCNQGIVIHGTNWQVRGNEVDQLVRSGNLDCDYIRFFGQNITISRNWLHGARRSEVGVSHVDGFQTYPNNGWWADTVTIDSNYVESFHQGAMIGVSDHANQSGYIRNLRFTNNVFIGGEIGASWGIQTLDTQDVYILNNLFLNFNSNGAAVMIRAYSRGTVQNNIFYNTGQNYYKDSTSTMYGGYNALNRQSSTPLYRNSLDHVRDPLLRNAYSPLGGDGRPWTSDDGFMLQTSSICRESGGGSTVSTDIFGRSRPQGSRKDIGPHEFVSTSSKSVTSLSDDSAVEMRVAAENFSEDLLWADVPPALEDLVRVEWVADEAADNGVWVRIVPLGDWNSLISAAGLSGKRFQMSVGVGEGRAVTRTFESNVTRSN